MTTLHTERLTLRPIDMARDFEAFAEAYADAETMRYIGGSPLSRAQAWRSVAMLLGHQQVRGYGFLSCIERNTGAWVGRVGPWFPEGWPAPEIGWTLHPDHTGKGLATEAARACLAHVRDELGWTSVIHLIAEGNAGSEAVAQRIGSTRQRRLDDGIPGVTSEPCWVWGQDL